MDRLRDYMEEMMKFTLQNPSDFDLRLSDDFCSGLLSGEPIIHAGVPVYPLYRRLALNLLKSIDSGSFCTTFEKIPLVKEVIWLEEREAEWGKLIIQKGSELINVLKEVVCELQVQESLFSFMKGTDSIS